MSCRPWWVRRLPWLLLVTGALVAAATTELPEVEGRPPAPQLVLPDLEGRLHRLDDYRGHTLIINFWATWCAPCRAEIPAMNRASRQLEPDGVVMFAVNSGEQPEQVRRFLKQMPIEFTVLLDPDTETAGNWSVPGLPTTYVVDSQGRVVYRILGRRDWDSEALLDQIRSLGGRETGPMTADSD